MLIGVSLPITEENVKNLNPFKLVDAHDLFLNHAQKDGNHDSIKQYTICRDEILSRLLYLYENYPV